MVDDMAAREHLYGEQLRMFIQAHELIDLPSRDVDDGLEIQDEHLPKTLWQDDDVRHAKIREAEDSGLIDSVLDHGVLKPVNLGFVHPVRTDIKTPKKLYILDGNHRIAAANEIDPSMYVPVTYSENEEKFYADHLKELANEFLD
jgi:hypothetical protein